MRARRRRLTPGFTLVEVLVAIAAGGLVALAARALVTAAGDGARRVASASAAADADANGLRLVRALVDQVDVASVTGDATAPTDGAAPASASPLVEPVAGDESGARLATWCATPGGWSVRCDAALRFEAPDTATRDRELFDLIVELSTGDRLVLRRGLRRPAFRYLLTAAGGGRWRAAWAGPQAPLALAVVGQSDTLLLPVGPRQ